MNFSAMDEDAYIEFDDVDDSVAVSDLKQNGELKVDIPDNTVRYTTDTTAEKGYVTAYTA